ncbi:MAG: aldehyde dehydrogenase family protein, partial [Hyphomicrobiaceae bacterium]
MSKIVMQPAAFARKQMLIDGAWVDATDGQVFEIENPARKEKIGQAPRAQATDVDRAVAAAAKAFPAWSKVVARDRGRLLLKIADALESRVEDLARIIATETGNALRTQARPEARGVADTFRYFGGLASELKGDTFPLGDNVLSYTRREPIGVVAAIVPWNAPGVLSAMKIAPAVCAG